MYFAACCFWTTATDIGHQPGQFYWANGRKIEQSLWALGKPDEFGLGKETCVALYRNYEFSDDSCSHTHYFICENDPRCK